MKPTASSYLAQVADFLAAWERAPMNADEEKLARSCRGVMNTLAAARLVKLYRDDEARRAKERA